MSYTQKLLSEMDDDVLLETMAEVATFEKVSMLEGDYRSAQKTHGDKLLLMEEALRRMRYFPPTKSTETHKP